MARTDQPQFKSASLPLPHKLSQVEWDFVEAHCKKREELGFIQQSIQSIYASATIVVRKMDTEENYTDFGSAVTIGR